MIIGSCWNILDKLKMKRNIEAVIFDMDGTALTQIKGEEALHCEPSAWIDVWRYLFYIAGLTKEIRDLTAQYQDQVTNSMTPAGHQEFFQQSCELLRGREAAPVLAAFQILPYTSGFLQFCDYLRGQSIKMGMVTLSLDAIAQQIKQEAGLEYAVGNEIHTDEHGLFTGTGKIKVPFGGKGKAVEHAYASLGTSGETTCFFGDSGNDVDCWKAVGLPLGMNIDAPYVHLVWEKFTDFHQAKEYFERENF